MLGAGTIALEVFEELPETGVLMVPIGGTGELALRVLTENIDDIVLVSDDDLRRATALALTEIGQTLEGAGAAALAALERYHDRGPGQVAVAVLTGGNPPPAGPNAALAPRPRP